MDPANRLTRDPARPRVLVTGLTGFVGRGTLAALQARGFEVHAVTSRRPPHDDRGVVWHQTDLLDPSATRSMAAASAPSHLLHLAWYVNHRNFWTARENIRWLDATLRLLEAFAAAGGRRAAVAGTCAEYRWGDDVLSETGTATEPSSLYGASKLAAGTAGAALADQLGVSLAWGRLFFPYGPGEHPDRVVPSVIRGLLAGERVATTTGSQVRDFMHVDDVGSALVALLGSQVRGVVNIGTGMGRSVREVIDTIAAAIGRPELIDFGAVPQREGDPLRVVADIRRLRDEVQWRPSISLDDGIAGTVESWRLSRRARL